MMIDIGNCFEYNQAIAELIPEALCILDVDYNIKFVNQRSLAILNIEDASHLLGKSILTFIAPEHHGEIVDVLQRCREKRAGTFSKYVLLDSAGERIIVYAASSPVFSHSGEILGYVCVGHDPSRVSQIILSERTSNRALFYLDLMSHDISNQLQIIMGASELLLHKLKGSPHEILLFDILDSVEKCTHIINTSEIMERIITSEKNLRSLRAVLHQLILTFLEKYDVDIHASLCIDESQILADEFLEQMLIALLENAIKHNPRNYKIIWLVAHELPDGYVVEISDNGSGIPDKVKHTVFEQEQRNGGLGLYLCSMIAEKYGASIELGDRIEGHPELGAKVRVVFKKPLH